jgi:hypothetical protein
MQTRTIIILLALVSFLTGVWLVAAQRQQLEVLRAARTAAQQNENQGENDSVSVETAAPVTTGQAGDLSSELLQLRGQVSLLGAQVRGLSSVTQENARLLGQLAATPQNAATGIKLPPGYVRKNQAKQAGYRTPEDTLQSFFYGLNQHDVEHVLSALTPSSAQRFQALQQDEFFKTTDQVPGYAVRGRNELPDGMLELQIEVAPGLPTEPFRFQQVNGEWKLVMPF